MSFFGKLTGFLLSGTEEANDKQKLTTPVSSLSYDGTINVISGSVFSTQVDLTGTDALLENGYILKYRELAGSAEASQPITEIVNEAIVDDDHYDIVTINLDKLDFSESLKDKIRAEFKTVLNLLNFNNVGWELFRRWYVDGRLFFHIIIDNAHPEEGIKQLKYIDALEIRKVREIQKSRDQETGVEIVQAEQVFYIYSPNTQYNNGNNSTPKMFNNHSNIKFTEDAIAYIHSGLTEATYNFIVSYLHKAIRPVNHLRYIEDSIVIYRLARSTERRIFYVDVGDMAPDKAEAFIQKQIKNYRNKMSYDPASGSIRDDKKFMSVLEDFWFPRFQGNRNTEVVTLPGGQNLGKLDDLAFFEKKVRRSMDLPISRTEEGGNGLNFGRSSEISRDERNFGRFVASLQKKYSELFRILLSRQLRLKGILSKEDWENEINNYVYFQFKKDSIYQEQQEIEKLQGRLSMLPMIEEYVGEGRYFSEEFVQKEVLGQTDDDIERIKKQNVGKKPLLPAGTSVGMPVGIPGTDYAPPEFQFQQSMMDKLIADATPLPEKAASKEKPTTPKKKTAPKKKAKT